jgi:transposase
VDFEMTVRGVDGVLALIRNRLAGIDAPMRVGIEAAGHYHRPLLSPSVWPAGCQVLELNPAHVAAQRRVPGRRRIKTDALELEGITELVLSGRGLPFDCARGCDR